MESRLEQMGKIATTADVLEAQQKEQKVKGPARTIQLCSISKKFICCDFSLLYCLQSFHAELHQYKYHVELFNQLTQKLIAVYPSDDTSRIKRMTETVNIRLVNRIISIY